jgi:hypothetical protein
LNFKPKITTMKKITLLVGVLTSLLVSPQLKAQDSIFDLKSYKTTNYERSSLDLIFNLGENSNKTTSEQDYQLSQKQEGSNLSANLDFNSTFSKILFTEKKIVEYGSTFSINEDYSNNWNQQTDSLTKYLRNINNFGDYQLSGFYNVDRYYSVSNKNYFKLGGNLSVEMTHSFYETKNSQNVTNKSLGRPYYNSDLSFDLGHGHGRIENVEDAVEALYILNDLSKSGLLSRSYTESDVKTLADKITLIKKERFFDERLYKQKSMKSLVSLLLDNNLIKSESVEVFNIIADYHYFAGIQTRPSGQKIEYFIVPELFLSGGKVADNEVNNSIAGRLGLTVAYSYSRPISIKWQQNINVSANASNSIGVDQLINKENSDYNHKSTTTGFEGEAIAGYSLGYFPNTRTYLSAGLNAQYNYRHSKGEDAESLTQSNLSTALRLNGYYYLSERLRLSGSFNFNLHDSEYNSKLNENNSYSSLSKYVSQGLNLDLTYFIF